MNRGSEQPVDLDNVLRRASMRPRFMNRGSLERLDRGGDSVGASMRPRFMNRGSDTAAIGRVICESGFNEAPIHESGKS